MNAAQASLERERLWRELKPLLKRSLGPVGAAEWMRFAADQVELEARRQLQPIEVFPVTEFRP